MPKTTPAAAMLLAALLVSPAALASDDLAKGACNGYDALKDNPSVQSARVAGDAKKVFFVKGSDDAKACPAEGAACARKAFLVPGDGVVVSGRNGAFSCVAYANSKGAETDGWLPASALAMDPSPGRTTVQEWAGSWMRTEARITIKPASGDRLSIKGDATFGATDPERVKRGGVNVGEIAGTLAPAGDRLSFSIGDDGKALAVDKGDEYACRVWMRRVGDYLLVDDNRNCGGMNVSFNGTYVRR